MYSKPAILLATVVVFLIAGVWAGSAGAVLIDFEGLVEGQIVDDEFAPMVTISATDNDSISRPAVIFDSNTSRPLEDTDLMSPWSGGNIGDLDLGNLLIIQDNERLELASQGIIAYPDDEGHRPAGSIFFNFASQITSFGFDLIDVEGTVEYNSTSGFFAVFYSGGSALASLGFGSFAGVDGVVYGDNTANRIAPITAADLGLTSFDQVEINFGGSGAIDNINYTPVPEPATMLLLGVGLIGLAGFGRRKLKRK